MGERDIKQEEENAAIMGELIEIVNLSCIPVNLKEIKKYKQFKQTALNT